MKQLILLFIFLSVVGVAEAKPLIDLDKIIKIESSWNHKALNKRTKATGLAQITPICLKEFNQFNKTKYTMEDMFNPQKNMRVAYWYLNNRIPQMLKHFKLPVTVDNVLIAYNSGIENVRRWRIYNETREYIKRYRR